MTTTTLAPTICTHCDRLDDPRGHRCPCKTPGATKAQAQVRARHREAVARAKGNHGARRSA